VRVVRMRVGVVRVRVGVVRVRVGCWLLVFVVLVGGCWLVVVGGGVRLFCLVIVVIVDR